MLDLGDEVSELAGLLDLMREPQEHVVRVEEVCVIDPQHAGQRTIALTLRTPPEMARRLIDVKHPHKGSLDLIEISGSCTVVSLSHHEHVRVSQNLITYRYLSLVRTATGLSEVDLVARVAHDLLALRRIPVESPDAALRIFDQHFARRGGHWYLHSFDSFGIRNYDQGMLDSLARLCKRLCRRYLQLIRIQSTGADTEDIQLRYTEEISSEPASPPAWWNVFAQLRITARDWLNAPSPTWRFHVPWAKRTSHYSFTITAPEDRFLALQGLAVAEAAGDVRAVLDSAPPDESPAPGIVFTDDQPKWSIQTKQGRGSSIFVSDAHTYQQRLFCVFRALELPGRSLLRMTFVTGFVLAVLGSLAIWKFMNVGALPQASTLVPTVLAVGALALGPQGSPGVLGYPAKARIAPAVLAGVCVVFSFWLTTTGPVSSPDALETLGVASAVEGTWDDWRKYGWAPVLGVLLVFWVHLVVTYRALVNAYRDRLSEKTLVSDNFYRREDVTPHG